MTFARLLCARRGSVLSAPAPAVSRIQPTPGDLSRWLSWGHRIYAWLKPAPNSPFNSPANAPLAQRVHLNGITIEIPLK